MKDKVDSVSLVQIGDGRFWSVSKPEPEMQTGRYVHESAIHRLQEEVEKLHHDWSDAYHDFVEWKGRAERAQTELEGLRYSNGTNATCAATFKADADALRKDAARYRWLRNDEDWTLDGIIKWGEGYEPINLTHDLLDGAIDIAMRRRK